MFNPLGFVYKSTFTVVKKKDCFTSGVSVHS